MREGFAIGIDIGGTGVRLGLFDSNESILGDIAFPTRGGGPDLGKRLVAASRELIDSMECPANFITAVGIAVAAMIDKDTQEFCVPNADFNLSDIGDEMRKAFPKAEVLVFNDADAALVGEMAFGAAQGQDDVFLITLGTGVGSAIASNGQVVLGAHGLAGEIGHMQIVTEGGRLCGCGGTGCLERYVSGPGVAFTAREFLAAHKGTSQLDGVEPLTSEAVFDAARHGDELAGRIIDNFVKTLAFSLRQVALLTDPGMFLIGGGMSRAGDVFVDKLVASYKQQVQPLYADIPISVAGLGNKAGYYGAAHQALVTARESAAE